MATFIWLIFDIDGTTAVQTPIYYMIYKSNSGC